MEKKSSKVITMKPKAVLPKYDKKNLLEAIRKKLAETEFPKEIQLNAWTKILDTRKYFESYLIEIEAYSGRLAYDSGDKLKEGLKAVGIDIQEIADSLEK